MVHRDEYSSPGRTPAIDDGRNRFAHVGGLPAPWPYGLGWPGMTGFPGAVPDRPRSAERRAAAWPDVGVGGIGKYFEARTFVAAEVRPTLTLPGVRFDRVLSPQMTLRATFESRFVPRRPTLTTGTRPETVRVVGATLNWRIGW